MRTSRSRGEASHRHTRREGSGSRDSGERLVGRLAELDLLKDAVHRMKDGLGCVVLIHGAPGIGKSRLAEEASDHAASVGCAVAWGRCSEDAGTPPFWPWTQLVPRVSDATGFLPRSTQGMNLMGSLAPDAGSSPRAAESSFGGGEAGEQIRFRLFDAFCRFLRHAARQRPLLLVLDDLHWADESSLRLFQHVAGETRESPLMLLGTYRETEGAATLREVAASLARLRRYARLPVRGLSLSESRELLEASCDSEVSEDVAEAAHRLTDGNPLHLRQISFSLPRARQSPGRPIDLAGSVHEIVQERLARASEGSRALVGAAAIMGSEFSVEILTQVAAEAYAHDSDDVVGEACAAHLLEKLPDSTERYRFPHALIREAVLAGLGQRDRVELHARAARALERLYAHEKDAHAAELLHHFAAAQPVLGSEPVVRYALLAGERALSAHAYEEAVGYFEAGLKVRGEDAMDDDAAALLFGMARTRALISMGHEAMPLFIRCFEYYERTGNMEKAVEVLTHGNIPREPALQPLIDRALRMVVRDSLQEAYLLMSSAFLHSLYSQSLSFDDLLLERIVTIARRNGDARLEMLALRSCATVTWIAERYDSRTLLDQTWRAREIASALDDELTEIWTSYGIVDNFLELGRVKEARWEAELLRATAERSEDRVAQTIAAQSLLKVEMQEGRWDAAFALCERIKKTSPPALLQSGETLYRCLIIHSQMGNLHGAAEDLAQLSEQARRTPRVSAAIFVFFPLAAAEAAYVLGDTRFLEEAASAARMLVGMPQTAPLKRTWARRALALIAAHRADCAEAEILVGHLRAALEGLPEEERPLHVGHHELGLLTRLIGDGNEALRHLENAVKRPSAAFHERTWAQHELAATLSERGRPGDARRAAALWQEALQASERLGLKPLERRIREGMNAATPRIPAAGQSAPAQDDLSSREIVVLQLVSRGLTNREIGIKLFISTKTVDAHVRSILEKTGMANRTEATAYAIRRGLAQ